MEKAISNRGLMSLTVNTRMYLETFLDAKEIYELGHVNKFFKEKVLLHAGLQIYKFCFNLLYFYDEHHKKKKTINFIFGKDIMDFIIQMFPEASDVSISLALNLFFNAKIVNSEIQTIRICNNNRRCLKIYSLLSEFINNNFFSYEILEPIKIKQKDNETVDEYNSRNTDFDGFIPNDDMINISNKEDNIILNILSNAKYLTIRNYCEGNSHDIRDENLFDNNTGEISNELKVEIFEKIHLNDNKEDSINLKSDINKNGETKSDKKEDLYHKLNEINKVNISYLLKNKIEKQFFFIETVPENIDLFLSYSSLYQNTVKTIYFCFGNFVSSNHSLGKNNYCNSKQLNNSYLNSILRISADDRKKIQQLIENNCESLQRIDNYSILDTFHEKKYKDKLIQGKNYNYTYRELHSLRQNSLYETSDNFLRIEFLASKFGRFFLKPKYEKIKQNRCSEYESEVANIKEFYTSILGADANLHVCQYEKSYNGVNLDLEFFKESLIAKDIKPPFLNEVQILLEHYDSSEFQLAVKESKIKKLKLYYKNKFQINKNFDYFINDFGKVENLETFKMIYSCSSNNNNLINNFIIKGVCELYLEEGLDIVPSRFICNLMFNKKDFKFNYYDIHADLNRIIELVKYMKNFNYKILLKRINILRIDKPNIYNKDNQKLLFEFESLKIVQINNNNYTKSEEEFDFIKIHFPYLKFCKILIVNKLNLCLLSYFEHIKVFYLNATEISEEISIVDILKKGNFGKNIFIIKTNEKWIINQTQRLQMLKKYFNYDKNSICRIRKTSNEMELEKLLENLV